MTNLSKIHEKVIAKTTKNSVQRLVKLGRKALPEDLQRVNRVAVRFNKSEFEAIKDFAQNRELAEVVRELTLEAMKNRQ